jgi:hypothetical protein
MAALAALEEKAVTALPLPDSVAMAAMVVKQEMLPLVAAPLLVSPTGYLNWVAAAPTFIKAALTGEMAVAGEPAAKDSQPVAMEAAAVPPDPEALAEHWL